MFSPKAPLKKQVRRSLLPKDERRFADFYWVAVEPMEEAL